MESPTPCHSRTDDPTDNILTNVDNLFTETNIDTNYPRKVIWTDNKTTTNNHQTIKEQQTPKNKNAGKYDILKPRKRQLPTQRVTPQKRLGTNIALSPPKKWIIELKNIYKNLPHNIYIGQHIHHSTQRVRAQTDHDRSKQHDRIIINILSHSPTLGRDNSNDPDNDNNDI